MCYDSYTILSSDQKNVVITILLNEPADSLRPRDFVQVSLRQRYLYYI